MKKELTALLCAAALPGLALADEPRYTYLEAGYAAVDLDDVNVDGDGFALGGSAAVTERVFVVADYEDIGLDGGIDISSWSLGVGGSLPLDRGLHLVGDVSYVSGEVETGFGDFDDDGFALSGGLRWMASPELELNGGLVYSDLDESGDDTALEVGALYSVTPELALGADVSVSDDVTAWGLNLRYYIPRM